jgi:hypothetical protein
MEHSPLSAKALSGGSKAISSSLRKRAQILGFGHALDYAARTRFSLLIRSGSTRTRLLFFRLQWTLVLDIRIIADGHVDFQHARLSLRNRDQSAVRTHIYLAAARAQTSSWRPAISTLRHAHHTKHAERRELRTAWMGHGAALIGLVVLHLTADNATRPTFRFGIHQVFRFLPLSTGATP